MRWDLGQKVIDKIRGKNGRTPIRKSHYGTRYIYGADEGNELIYKMLQENRPLMICRYGSVELDTVSHFVNHISSSFVDFCEMTKHDMSYNAGFFPADNRHLTRFSSELINVTKNADIWGAWFWPKEAEMLEKFAPSVKIVEEGSLAPYWIPNPWTRWLKGKKVLVIHPFVDSIQSQYKKRDLWLKNKDSLPDFELITLRAVQSIHECVADLPYKTWFEALEDMKSKIRKIDFDIALICAGAYGIFLADFCKRIGKIGVHTGSGLQLMFGIRGKRWAGCLEGIANEHWVYPLESERPKGYEKVEKGCYW